MLEWTSPVQAPPFPFPRDAGDRLSVALRDSLVRFATTKGELRDAIEACVRSLREQQMSPEGTIITIKAFIRHIAARPDSKQARTSGATDADFFMDDVVHWIVVEYFKA